MYTVHQLAELAGVSKRTLRYYDQIDLLKPAFINQAGYRIYEQKQVDLLQQILFYREFNVPLEEIKHLITSSDFDREEAMQNHYEKLVAERQRLDQLIQNVLRTIQTMRGENAMTSEEKFEGLKRELIKENEASYGEEIRQKYGEDLVEQANKKWMGMTKEQFRKFKQLEKEIAAALQKALDTGDPAGEEAQKLVGMHMEWLGYTWSSYTADAHRGLADMYVADERFTAYYDKVGKGAANFLRDAIYACTKR